MWMYFRGFERLIVTFCVPLLIYIGYRLFMTGVTGEMKITAKMERWSGSITAVAPGSLCFLLGVALGAYIMFTKVTSNPPDSPTGAGSLSFLGGGDQATTYPLSVRLKMALGELLICNSSQGENDREPCKNAYQRSFKLVCTENLIRIDCVTDAIIIVRPETVGRHCRASDSWRASPCRNPDTAASAQCFAARRTTSNACTLGRPCSADLAVSSAGG
jgi:hypothetical protein